MSAEDIAGIILAGGLAIGFIILCYFVGKTFFKD
jgi:hypothetical protein